MLPLYPLGIISIDPFIYYDSYIDISWSIHYTETESYILVPIQNNSKVDIKSRRDLAILSKGADLVGS